MPAVAALILFVSSWVFLTIHVNKDHVKAKSPIVQERK